MNVAGYRVEEKLGAGGFGTVYRVSKEGQLDRALKVLNADLLTTETAATRFEREVDTLRSLGHEGTVQVFESGRLSDGSPFFVMELLDGEELAALLDRTGRLAHSEILRVLQPICATLQSAHEHGIVHRDIKASNVFLCTDGRVVLLDFGIAKVLETPGMTLTMTNQIVGSACAMSPEQLVGDPVSRQTDVYGVGALTFHMLTGTVPFASESLTMTQHLHGHAARVPPSSLAPVKLLADRVIIRSMSLYAHDRQASSEEFYRQLAAAMSGKQDESTRSAQAVVAHIQLGTCGDDAQKAEAAQQVLSEILEVMRPSGFTVVAKRMRGLCCARVLSNDVDAATIERAKSRQAVAEARALIMRKGPAGSTIKVADGVLEVAGQAIRSGAVLVPPS